jgi:hypothetical protein
MSHPMFKNIHRVMKNCISTITQMEEQAIRILPKSEDKIKRVVDNDKVLVISSIVEKLSYMSLEDLEILDDDIKIDDNNVIIST